MRSIGRQHLRRRIELVAQIEELLAICQHALVDLEDHRQQRRDEQHLALVAVLVAEIGRHAVDLVGRHRLALANVGQRVGDVAEETGQLVGRARADRANLDLAANRIAGGGEAAMGARTVARRAIDHVIRLAHLVPHEREGGGFGIQAPGMAAARAS